MRAHLALGRGLGSGITIRALAQRAFTPRVGAGQSENRREARDVEDARNPRVAGAADYAAGAFEIGFEQARRVARVERNRGGGVHQRIAICERRANCARVRHVARVNFDLAAGKHARGFLG